MKKSAYGKPILINKDSTQLLDRIEDVDELTIQNLVFEFPESLPIRDIDESYNPLLPVCKELRTQVGPLDILMITPNGDIAIIETKLWRNPEARRKVVAQILDYANELSKWTYEDLQREVNRNLKNKGNTLFNIAKNNDLTMSLTEADFVDAISRNLNRGKFLLLIVGDGIKEGAISITDFLSNSANMNFSFGMVELTLFKLSNDQKIILPRTIAKTTEIQKIYIELPDGFNISNTGVNTNELNKMDSSASPELEQRRIFFSKFWPEFISELDLDDPGQTLPKPFKNQNLFLYPGNNKYSWISAYFSQSTKRVGVYFRCSNDQTGQDIAESLLNYKREIENELGSEVRYSWESSPIDSFGFGIILHLENVYSNENREKIKGFFSTWINQFINVIRPRLKQIQNTSN